MIHPIEPRAPFRPAIRVEVLNECIKFKPLHGRDPGRFMCQLRIPIEDWSDLVQAVIAAQSQGGPQCFEVGDPALMELHRSAPAGGPQP